MAVVLHPFQQRFDRLGTEVLARLAAARERVRLVDEEHAVERALHGAIRLQRGRADVFAHESRTIHLDELAALEQSHRAVHLREQPRDRGLTGAGIAEKDEMLARRDLGEPVLLPPRLHLQERDERAHLLLHRLEPDQRVELGLQLVQAALRLRLQRAQLFGELVADGLPDAFAERLQRLGGILEWVSAHHRSMLVAGGKEGRCGSTYLWARC